MLLISFFISILKNNLKCSVILKYCDSNAFIIIGFKLDLYIFFFFFYTKKDHNILLFKSVSSSGIIIE